MLGNIYIIKNTINNKVYIGQTKQNLETRFSNHKISSKNEDTKFYRAMRKYGVDKFYIELIEQVSFGILDEREKYWINYYDSYVNGYNSTLGGQGIRGIDYEEVFTLWNQGKCVSEISKLINHGRDAVSRILKENFNITEEDIKLRGQESKYVLNNKQLLDLWNSGLTPNQITKNYGGDLNITKKRLYNLGITEELIKERITQNQRNLSMEKLQFFWDSGLSIAEIARRSGSNVLTIKKQLEQLGYTSNDFILRKKQTCNQNRRAVVQLDVNNNYIAQYESALQAQQATGAASSAIGACCNHKPKYKTAKGFKWLFLSEYEEIKNEFK